MACRLLKDLDPRLRCRRIRRLGLRHDSFDRARPRVSHLAEHRLGVSLAPVLLLSLPGAQWLVLRRYVPKAWKWVIWSTAGWLVALPPTFIGPAILPSDASSLQIAATWAISGMAMAAIIAAFTGYAMSRILQSTVANLDAGTLRAPG
ncbi:hypothetical protein [Candidatus Amarobacter glycogenicus]|uniref:hypothetical protein n=1 Tax=Candidatus Amarobacter glycogenicus TaxID=3140699 RepID=UPI0031376930|nr:hypothetical protein [Dehalococcoidia bacterium]